MNIPVTVANLSNLPRSHWGELTAPADSTSSFGAEASLKRRDGLAYRAVKGETVAGQTTWRVYMRGMGGDEIVRGELSNTPHETAEGFRWHPWTSDRFDDLLPSLLARDEDGRDWETTNVTLNLEDHSNAHQRWHVVRRIPEVGLRLELWVTLLHNDPVALVTGKIVWSHRADSRLSRRFQFFAIKSRERIVWDFGTRHGMQPTLQLEDGSYVQVLCDRWMVMADGAPLPLSGSMLTFRAGAGGDVDEADIANLRAAVGGPILGVAGNWHGSFTANVNLASFYQPAHAASEQLAAFGTWRASLQQTAGWYVWRDLILTPTPGQTGFQPDFGAVKGTQATVFGDPRHIYRMRYAVQAELFRGCHIYEDDGTPLRVEDHPNWVTWSLDTHFNNGVSPDRLGKVWSALPGNGWIGQDDQHASMNNVAAYIALTNDPLMRDHLTFLATFHEAAYRIRYPTYGLGAARAQGRTCQALANMITVADAPVGQRLRWCLEQRLAHLVANPNLTVSGPVKLTATGGPDPRKNVFLQSGERAAWTSIWEHGLWLVGMYQALRVAASPQVREMFRTVATTMAEYAFWQEPEGTWWTVGDLAWLGGAPPTGGLSRTNPEVSGGPGLSGGVSEWTFAGILAAREFLGSEHPLAPRMDAYIAWVKAHHTGDDLTRAEWWAINARS